MRDFAERLIAYETRRNRSSRTKTPVACLVIDKLRPQLATLIGNIGFRALLSRTLALSNTEPLPRLPGRGPVSPGARDGGWSSFWMPLSLGPPT